MNFFKKISIFLTALSCFFAVTANASYTCDFNYVSKNKHFSLAREFILYINNKSQDGFETLIEEDDVTGKTFYIFSKYTSSNNQLTDTLSLTFEADAQRIIPNKHRPSFNKIKGEASSAFSNNPISTNLKFSTQILSKDKKTIKGLVNISCSLNASKQK